MILLDTHAWVWYIDSPDTLSDVARKTIEQARAETAVYVSSISAWEIYMLVDCGRLEFTIEPDVWITRCERLSFMKFLPVDNEIARLAVRLPGTFHDDPADRMIAASARFLGVPLVTKDRKIRRYRHVKTIW